jgi:callose synthase
MLMLQVPYASGVMPVIQWPVFLLAGKINSAVQHAAHHKGDDKALWEQLSSDELMRCAVIEAYNALRILLKALVSGQAELR